MESLYLNKSKEPVIISIVSTKSGTGKTTLIEGLIKVFKDRNYTIGILKHDAHKFNIDKKGKDSYRFTEAGADNVVIASSEKLAMVQILKEKKKIEDIINLFSGLDIVLVEGFKSNEYPKIEVHRKGVDDNLLCKNPEFDMNSFLAIASDESLDVNIPILDINDVVCIADFIGSNFLKKI